MWRQKNEDDCRFSTPRQSARRVGRSCSDESWVSARSMVPVSYLSSSSSSEQSSEESLRLRKVRSRRRSCFPPNHESPAEQWRSRRHPVENVFSLARHNRFEEVERILTRGVPPDARDDCGNTILIIACQNGHKRIAKVALRRGADIDARNYQGHTALHYCLAYGYETTLGAYLITKGADTTSDL